MHTLWLVFIDKNRFKNNFSASKTKISPISFHIHACLPQRSNALSPPPIFHTLALLLFLL